MANTFRIGDIEVIVVSDGEAIMQPTQYFPASTTEAWEAHKQLLDPDGTLRFPFTCFVLRTGGKAVLIDTGLGPFKSETWRGGDMLPELAAAGVKPDEIDTVFITHLHADHCGGAAMRDEQKQMHPTFPNATYRWTQAEQEYWTNPDLPKEQVARRDVFTAVADRFDPADGGTTLAPGITVYSMPGHTAGHAGVVVASGGDRAFILGDGVSCPCSSPETEWSGMGDFDPKLARASQEAMAREVEGTPVLVRGSHFPGLEFGRVLVSEGKRYWQT